MVSHVQTQRERPTLTDAGNAQRFAMQHGAWMRYCYAWRSSLTWDGKRWSRDPGDAVMRLAKSTARSIYAEAARADDDDVKALASWAKRSEAEARLRAMTFLAQSEPGIAVTPVQLDAEPWLLNTETGTLDLRTVELRPHRREELLTKLAPVAYDATAECPRWLAFLSRIFDDNEALIAFLQRALGYALTADTREQCFFLLWGAGANGKTTLLKTVSSILGDYAVSTRAETFMVKGSDAIPNDVAQLAGSRFVVAVEAEQDRRLAEALMKQATGGDVMSARFMRGEFFEFAPTFKVFIATNHKPIIRGTDHAMWRRVRLIPFTVTIADDQQDKMLEGKLRGEGAGILRWMVEGCLAWQRDGLGVPVEVRAATASYRSEMDVVGRFLADRCALDQSATITAADLYADYVAWCDAEREKPISKTMLGLRLAERPGLEDARLGRNRTRAWRGIRLRSPAEPEPDATVLEAVGAEVNPW